MKAGILPSTLVIGLSVMATAFAQTDAQPVSINAPKTTAYVGQRVPFFVEVLSKGPFGGATSFTIPKVPNAIIVKVGDPVVSSKQIAGENWFVQTHEFALFSQHGGDVTIPGFPVRFGTREAISGPVKEMTGTVPSISLKVTRPQGVSPDRFLVTTKDFSVEENWNPKPVGEVRTGTVFKRTVTQSASDMTGMALAPASAIAPDGVRVYSGSPKVDDETERGEFSGRRMETLTYLVERPGNYELPALHYDWWNPESEQLETKTLPAVSFLAIASSTFPSQTSSKHESFFILLILAAGLLVALWHYRMSAAKALVRFGDRIDPPSHRAARALLRSCRRNDSEAAIHAWERWRSLNMDTSINVDLQEHIVGLQRCLFGKSPGSWNGTPLEKSFRQFRCRFSAPVAPALLPPLNP